MPLVGALSRLKLRICMPIDLEKQQFRCFNGISEKLTLTWGLLVCVLLSAGGAGGPKRCCKTLLNLT